MPDTTEELHAIELSIEQAQEFVKKMEAIERLKQNPDFKEIFLDGYLKEYAVSLVHRKTLIGMQDDKQQTYLNNQMLGISAMVQFMNYTVREGRSAAQALEAHQAERDRLLEEQEEA